MLVEVRCNPSAGEGPLIHPDIETMCTGHLAQYFHPSLGELG